MRTISLREMSSDASARDSRAIDKTISEKELNRNEDSHSLPSLEGTQSGEIDGGDRCRPSNGRGCGGFCDDKRLHVALLFCSGSDLDFGLRDWDLLHFPFVQVWAVQSFKTK